MEVSIPPICLHNKNSFSPLGERTTRINELPSLFTSLKVKKKKKEKKIRKKRVESQLTRL